MLDVLPQRQHDERDIEELIAALHNEDDDIRAMAARELGRLRTRQAVEPLLAALNDPRYWLVRCNAAEALGMIGDVRAVEPLIASLKHLDMNTQIAAAEALGNLGDPRAIEALSARLRTGSGRIFKASSEALEKLGGSTIVMAEQGVRAKRVSSIEMMKSGGVWIACTLYSFLIFAMIFAKIVPPSSASDDLFGIIVLILALFVAIGVLVLLVGFVRWSWFNRP
jgi:HEAT repeats/PBS lyase HEAT-like repeat